VKSSQRAHSEDEYTQAFTTLVRPWFSSLNSWAFPFTILSQIHLPPPKSSISSFGSEYVIFYNVAFSIKAKYLFFKGQILFFLITNTSLL
jgi:hypothetical protein